MFKFYQDEASINVISYILTFHNGYESHLLILNSNQKIKNYNYYGFQLIKADLENNANEKELILLLFILNSYAINCL